jgi:hypothetical protein
MAQTVGLCYSSSFILKSKLVIPYVESKHEGETLDGNNYSVHKIKNQRVF